MKRLFILGFLLAGLWARAFGQTELITNGGFEFGLSGWATNTGVTTVTNPVHSGSYSLSLTTVAGTQQAVYQTITLPPNLLAATLSYYFNVYSSDPFEAPNAFLSVIVADNTGRALAQVDSESNTNRDPVQGIFHSVTFDLMPYTNHGTLQIQFTAYSTATAGATQFTIDDVSVQTLDNSARGSNDNFTNATLLAGTNITLQATNTYATKEPGEPNHAGNSGGHSLWWDWTAPGWGVVTITTDGSSFDTLLAAYTGTAVNSLTRVAANDNDQGGASMTSTISFPTSPGADYKIAVDGANGATGQIALSLSFVPDTKAPTVAFTSPSAGATVTNTQVTFQGTASDNVAVAGVQFRLENAAGTNDYQAAVGTNHWSATVTGLVPGFNTVRVRAYDNSGNISGGTARTVYYDVVSRAKGSYAGLFLGNTPGLPLDGFFTATIASRGKLSGKLLLAGKGYSFSGQVDSNGLFSASVPPKAATPLQVQFSVDLTGGGVISGTVSNNLWTTTLTANRFVYSQTSPAPQGPKKYTLVIQAADTAQNQPVGYGFGTVNLDKLGHISFSGTLGDGTKVSQHTFVSEAGTWPFYLSALGGKEVLDGWLSFTNTADSDFSGLVNWTRGQQTGKLYPQGFSFTNDLGVVGSLYAFTTGVPLLNLPAGGQVVLSGANLAQDLSTGFTLDTKNKVTGTNKLSLTFSTGTGSFKGTVPVAGTTKPIAISGVLLQKQNAGFGVFLGTNQAGQVTLGE